MAKEITEEVDRFQAIDSKGNVYTVVITQRFVVDDNNRKIPAGLKHATTLTGQNLNYKQEGVFEIVQSGVLIRRME